MLNPGHHRRRGNHRSKTCRPVIDYLRPGQAAFKIVCHTSAVGGVIGASGSIVSHIRRETSCIVTCEELVEGAEHRVFLVVGSATPERRLALRAAEDYQGSGEELVSDAQEAVLRVMERMWEVCRVKWRGKAVGGGGGGSNEGFCGLLADGQQVGVVVGKGGRTINRMKSISGAHINILPAPPCASPEEQLIQITGSVLAVKRAIVVVTARLQGCSPFERDPFPIPMRPTERSSPTTPFEQHLEFFPHLSSKLPSLIHNPVDTNYSLTNGDDDSQEVSFRLLVSNDAAGCIIGTGGSRVKSLQNQTGASIRFAAPKTRSGERVVTVSAFEILECSCSPAQSAADLVFARSIESEFEKSHSSWALTDGTAVKARLLLDLDHVSFLAGCNGTEASKGATIELQALEDSTTDFVLEISGEYKNVRSSLSRVTGILRDSVFPGDMVEEAITGSSKVGLSNATSSTFLKPGQGDESFDVEDNLSRGGRTTAIKAPNDPASLESPSKVSELERCMHFLLPRGMLKEVD
ncbi:unnamed protein product [Linum trigynum]|uniref:K Homology domain-containing protein n=1 Tax=Linum trigynum TaxID=586398 RepID=A0AAV2FR88_9ROSI